MRTSSAIFCIVIFIASIMYTFWDNILDLFEDEVIVLLPEPEPDPEPEPEPFKLVFASLMKEQSHPTTHTSPRLSRHESCRGQPSHSTSAAQS